MNSCESASDLIVLLCLLKVVSINTFHVFNLDDYAAVVGRASLKMRYMNSVKSIVLLEKMLRNMNE